MRKTLVAAVAVCLSGALLWAGPLVAADFSAKRIGIPAAGERRLTVQIDPEAQRAALAALPRPGATVGGGLPADGLKPSPPTAFSWFWDKISPELARSGPGRLRPALDTLAGARSLPEPRLSHLQSIAILNAPHILRATVGTQISPALVLAMIAVESSGRVDAESGAGAQGLMQLMPQTAARFGVRDSLDPQQNITGGVKYLDWLMQEFGGDPILALAGYNAGEGAVRKHAGVPPYPETRAYVPKVLAAFKVARGLCRTPPELASDGCIFVSMK